MQINVYGGKSCFIYVLLESSIELGCVAPNWVGLHGTEVMFISASKMSSGDVQNILVMDLCEQ